MLVDEPVTIWIGDCGLVNCFSPRSSSGLKVPIGTPRLAQGCNSCSIRGLLDPTFWPKNKMQSAFSKSSSVRGPTGAPRLCLRPTEVDSWHMLELSGRLLQPYMRAKMLYMYDV